MGPVHHLLAKASGEGASETEKGRWPAWTQRTFDTEKCSQALGVHQVCRIGHNLKEVRGAGPLFRISSQKLMKRDSSSLCCQAWSPNIPRDSLRAKARLTWHSGSGTSLDPLPDLIGRPSGSSKGKGSKGGSWRLFPPRPHFPAGAALPEKRALMGLELR